jgi:hypothetical protein
MVWQTKNSQGCKFIALGAKLASFIRATNSSRDISAEESNEGTARRACIAEETSIAKV